MARPRLLFLAHLLPWPLDGGGQIKSYHTLKILSSVFDVTLLAFTRQADEGGNVQPLLPLCKGGVQTVFLARGKVRNAVAGASSLVRQTSFLMSRDDAPLMRQAVEQHLAEHPYAVLHVDHLQMMQFVPAQTGETRVVLDNHNMEHLIPKRIGETPGAKPWTKWLAGQEWPKLREFEIASVRRADLTLTVSPEDRAGLAALDKEIAHKVASVPIGVDTNYFRPATDRPPSQTLLSIGTMFWPPNVDAMQYFCSDIFPLVKKQISDVKLAIVGARPTDAVRALAENDDSVVVTGSVPDVRPYAYDCGAFIVPLRSGSGMRVKILNALAMGLPVVSTTMGAEGIHVTHDKHLLLANTPQAFAHACVRVLQHSDVAARLGRDGRLLMEQEYSWEAVGKQLLDTYGRVVPLLGGGT